MVSPSTPGAPFLLSIRHVSVKNCGVSKCAKEVNRSFRSVLAFSATLVNPVVMRTPSLCRAHVALPRDILLVASPCPWLSHVPSTINESDSHGRLGLSLDVLRSSLLAHLRDGTAVGLPGS